MLEGNQLGTVNAEDQRGFFMQAFRALTSHEAMPWQVALYERCVRGDFPASCNLPTGLGKTSIIHIWLIALAAAPAHVPRRLVYVVNRRTVVDQATREAEKIRANLGKIPALGAGLAKLCAMEADPPLAISTLRGQFALLAFSSSPTAMFIPICPLPADRPSQLPPDRGQRSRSPKRA